MTAEQLLPRLEAVRARGTAKWSARCPSHPDKSPSLTVAEGEKGILLKCWAGCTLEEVTSALGLRVADLFSEAPLAKGQRPIPPTTRLDRRALAFRFELYALDLRLRAERVLQALKGSRHMTLTETDRDRLIKAAASAYQDEERASLFVQLADSLHWKTFQERKVRHAV